jgi:hypothetical protein
MARAFKWVGLHAGKAYKVPNSRDFRDVYYDNFEVLRFGHIRHGRSFVKTRPEHEPSVASFLLIEKQKFCEQAGKS